MAFFFILGGGHKWLEGKAIKALSPFASLILNTSHKTSVYNFIICHNKYLQSSNIRPQLM
jgi:hypothetical protein